MLPNKRDINYIIWPNDTIGAWVVNLTLLPI